MWSLVGASSCWWTTTGRERLALTSGDERGSLVEVLDRSRAWGFLGPGPVHHHIQHAEAYLPVVAPALPGPAMDLGSGGGVPGLVLALAQPQRAWVLLDAHERRATFLEWAVGELGVENYVTVLRARAEEVGRARQHRGRYALVTARSFGPPAVLAECAAPFLFAGGLLVSSEPPGGDPRRWPEEGLTGLGLELESVEPGPPALVQLRQAVPVADRWPRRAGVPLKRPLWTASP